MGSTVAAKTPNTLAAWEAQSTDFMRWRDGEIHVGSHGARGPPPASTTPATCRSAYWLGKQEVEDGAGTLAARGKVATENARWRTKEMDARADITLGGRGAN